MSGLNQLGRLVNGLSLVAKEIAKRSQTVDATRTGDLETLITSSLKKALVSATDTVGLTKGTVREFSKPKPKESVVYFNDSADVAETTSADDKGSAIDQSALPGRDVSHDSEKSADRNVEAKVLEPSTRKESSVKKCESNNLSDKVDVDGGREVAAAVAAAVPEKRRRPRERKVPSTPFSRLIG